MDTSVLDIAEETSRIDIPRIMIAGTGSGCGKTTVTCALLKAFIRRRLAVTSFKCGPDYIDPMFHSEMIGAKSRNLDMFLCGEKTTKYLLAQNAKDSDLSIIEGVMGFYDGLGVKDSEYSSFDLSEKTQTPVILIINASGMSMSVLAMVKGFVEFRQNNIAGIILNEASPVIYPQLKEMIESSFNVKVMGYMPKSKDVILESRHLGLVTAAEVPLLQNKLETLADMAEKYLDLDAIYELANSAPELEYNEISVNAGEKISARKETSVKIAVAKDEAFCFYYEDSHELLRRMGAELVSFSPLNDERLPDGISGLILGGGYPEVYLARLSENVSMKESIKNAIDDGLPAYAECGGFMYLGKWLDGFPMVGAIDMKSEMTVKLQNFGYITMAFKNATAFNNATALKSAITPKNGLSGWSGPDRVINAHEFHYSTSNSTAGAFISTKVSTGKQWDSIAVGENLFAGYPHLHFWGNPQIAENFFMKCRRFTKNRCDKI
ncbi:MAG: cobyrinate a,c-diamide synthase [Saccharofermentanales bacterium]